METTFKTTSFIPKASLDNVVDDRGKIQRSSTDQSGNSSFFVLIAFFLFVCSLVSAAIIFSLNQVTISQIKSANDSLVTYQKNINKDTIEEIKSLNSRLSIIQSLVNRHIAPSAVFPELSKNTIRQVSFSSFDLKRTNDNTFALSLRAQGVGYESIVAQDIQFASGPAQKSFKNTSITDFIKSKGQDLASFNINTTVSNNVVNFAEIINKSTNQ